MTRPIDRWATLLAAIAALGCSRAVADRPAGRPAQPGERSDDRSVIEAQLRSVRDAAAHPSPQSFALVLGYIPGGLNVVTLDAVAALPAFRGRERRSIQVLDDLLGLQQLVVPGKIRAEAMAVQRRLRAQIADDAEPTL